MTNVKGCRDYRPLLGMYALGRLTPQETVALQAHLDGCPLCRLEVHELSGVAAALAQADPSQVEDWPEPAPPRPIVFEQKRPPRRRRRPLLLGSFCIGLVTAAGALAGMLWLGHGADPAKPGGQTVSYSSGGVQASATLTDRPWGTLLNLSISGLNDGQQYMVWLERPDGSRAPAGSFTGQGSRRLTMVLASGLKLTNATAFGLSMPGGTAVLRAPITPR